MQAESVAMGHSVRYCRTMLTMGLGRPREGYTTLGYHPSTPCSPSYPKPPLCLCGSNNAK